MTIVAPPAAAPSSTPPEEARVRALGRQIAAGQAKAGRTRTRALEDRGMEWLARDPALRAALFRLVDVAPACENRRDLAAHLAALLGEAERPGTPIGFARRVSTRRAGGPAVGALADLVVHRMATRFIVGADPGDAVPKLEQLWREGAAASVDLLGEATVTAAEADRYARRCDEALRTLADAARTWPARPTLDVVPRVNLSVKVTALTAKVKPDAPELGIADARHRLRTLLRTAKRVGAHLHVDMESMDSRELITQLVIDLLGEPEFRDGPSAGIVLQAYLKDADEQLDQLLDGIAQPFTVRLVKGAYWEHETVEARQHGWAAPVYETKVESDRAFECLTRRLLQARPHVRVAIASHNVRSIAHALACAPDRDLELQVLRGLGDDLQQALTGMGLRVRTYCPVGDLVAGMSYLVRRLLENTSNDSFLVNRTRGADLDALLTKP
ncbi:proline dehydrogenase family protein [Solirubrobacter sp. CPCC 204708]|uniref:Proline dehydrogenase family protein n=1 Tax=Solirubrobacter deserti TaxID=2282478 RepID=A0ABT4RM38_9ACTN|nr:proline dehydrogenase family protein [Solirubrobacter deserti]MBE2314459.1 proline dehydrogenase family protein [Solirubrobacter deserti]MDA0139606.1 proline dehydrogenase family protein [Solirubrobacter deserti]